MTYTCIHTHTHIYIVVKTREFSENKVLRVHLLRHVVTLCFIYIDDDDDLQTGIYIYIRHKTVRCSTIALLYQQPVLIRNNLMLHKVALGCIIGMLLARVACCCSIENFPYLMVLCYILCVVM